MLGSWGIVLPPTSLQAGLKIAPLENPIIKYLYDLTSMQFPFKEGNFSAPREEVPGTGQLNVNH